jgi:hypothetical protein
VGQLRQSTRPESAVAIDGGIYDGILAIETHSVDRAAWLRGEEGTRRPATPIPFFGVSAL